jgi:hypothetical protein
VPAAGFAVALLLALRLGRRRLLGGGGGAKVRGWLDRAPVAIRRVLGTGPATAAVLATLAVFLLPGLRAHAAAGDLLLTGVTAALLVLVVVRGRRAAARAAGAAIRQRAWTPGVLAGLAAAAAGAPWAPLPVVEPASAAKAVHWIGPVLAALTGVVLLALGAWLDVPATTAGGEAALVMAASLLTPLRPVDGGVLGEGSTARLGNVLLAAVSALAILHVAG